MSVMASQIAGVSIVYSTVCSGVDQRKHQSSASLAFVRGIHRWAVNSPHKGPMARKTLPFDDVIMGNHRLPVDPHPHPSKSKRGTVTVFSFSKVSRAMTLMWRHCNVLWNAVQGSQYSSKLTYGAAFCTPVIYETHGQSNSPSSVTKLTQWHAIVMHRHDFVSI